MHFSLHHQHTRCSTFFNMQILQQNNRLSWIEHIAIKKEAVLLLPMCKLACSSSEWGTLVNVWCLIMLWMTPQVTGPQRSVSYYRRVRRSGHEFFFSMCCTVTRYPSTKIFVIDALCMSLFIHLCALCMTLVSFCLIAPSLSIHLSFCCQDQLQKLWLFHSSIHGQVQVDKLVVVEYTKRSTICSTPPPSSCCDLPPQTPSSLLPELSTPDTNMIN